MSPIRVFLVPISMAIASLLAIGCEEQSSYYQCITDGQVSEEHKRACMTRFQAPLPQSVVASIRGEAELLENIRLFSGNIFNRTSDWLITEIVVVLYPDGLAGRGHEFRAAVDAGPLSSSHFSVGLYSGITKSESFIWQIDAAYGVPAR